MVQTFARVAVAVVALNAAASLAQYQFDNAELETRETAPYVRRHFTRSELAERGFETSDLQPRAFTAVKAAFSALKNNLKVQKAGGKEAGKDALKQQKANQKQNLANVKAKGSATAPAGGSPPPAGGPSAPPAGGPPAPPAGGSDPSAGGSDPSASPDAGGGDPSVAPQRRALESDFYELDARDLDYELDDLE